MSTLQETKEALNELSLKKVPKTLGTVRQDLQSIAVSRLHQIPNKNTGPNVFN